MKGNKKHSAVRILWIVCLLLTFSITALAGTEETVQEREGRIEQVYINLPEIDVYMDGVSASGREFSAYLGDEKLKLGQVQNFSESGQGIYYYVLLDISDSIPDGYFNEIKEGILEFHQGMGEKDRLFLYTFGVEVERVLDGTQSREEAEERIDGLKNRDQKTSLYEAIHMAAKDAKQVLPNECRRRVLAVISDGEDVAVGKKTGAEALNTLKESGLPVYAFGIRDTKREHLNQFGELSRMSGGELTIFGRGEGDGILKNLRERLEGSEILQLKAKSNLASNRPEHFTITFTGGEEYTKEVMSNRWIKDQTAPELTEIRQEGAKNLYLTFSEPVNGAGDAQSYRIVRIKRVGAKDADSALELIEKVKDGPSFEEVPVAVTAVTKESDRSYLLTLTENMEVGEYRIECPGITDISMEQNPLKMPGSLQVLTKIQDEAERQTWIERMKGVFDNWTWRLLLFAVGAGLIGFTIYFIKIRKTLTNMVNREDRPDTQDGPGGAGTGILVDLGEVKELTVFMTDQMGREYQAVIKKERSILGGRSSMCELHFNDMGMSRKHFLLEWDGKLLTISDLETTNGTRVNDAIIKEKKVLNPGDVIKAGATFLTVRW